MLSTKEQCILIVSIGLFLVVINALKKAKIENENKSSACGCGAK